MTDRQKIWGLGLMLVLTGLLLTIANIGLLRDPEPVILTLILYAAAFFFCRYYRSGHGRWWAVLPAGACIVLGTITLIDAYGLLSGDLQGTVCMFGLGLTFLYLWVIRDRDRRPKWALITALALFILAVVVFLDVMNGSRLNIILAIALLAAGLAVILRARI